MKQQITITTVPRGVIQCSLVQIYETILRNVDAIRQHCMTPQQIADKSKLYSFGRQNANRAVTNIMNNLTKYTRGKEGTQKCCNEKKGKRGESETQT